MLNNAQKRALKPGPGDEELEYSEALMRVDGERCGTEVRALESEAAFLDRHLPNVFDHRIAQLVDVVDALTWSDGRPTVPSDTLG
jgi:hypothetical protein